MAAVDMPPPPRRRGVDATRAALLVAARRRFVVHGYERTTTRSIADDAGVNVSLISRYFGSKDGLYATVLDESAEALGAEEGEAGSADARSQLIDRVVRGMRPESWPDFGHQHPMLLFVKDVGADPALDRLRRESVLGGVRAITRQLEAEGDPQARRRVELAMALTTGLVVLRDLLGDVLEVTGDEDALRADLERLLEQLAPTDTEPVTSPEPSP